MLIKSLRNGVPCRAGSSRNYAGRLSHAIAVEILDTMAAEGSVEWAGADAGGVGGLGLAGVGGGAAAAVTGAAGKSGGKITAIVWWKKPEEWANMIYDWVRLLPALKLCSFPLSPGKCPHVCAHAYIEGEKGKKKKKKKIEEILTQH